MLKNYLLVIILGIFVGSAFIYGVSRSGSPFETRGKKFDEQRVSDISSLSYSVEAYYSQNNRLPQALSDIPKDNLYGKEFKDPESSLPYEYQALDNTSYKICANFSTDSSKSQKNQNPYSYTSTDTKFYHPKGNHCFDLNTSGVVLNPTSTPSPIALNSQAGVIDTSEDAKRSRDATRLSDLSNMQNAINVTVQEATSASAVLCSEGLSSNGVCTGKTLSDGNTPNGTGWLKVNLANTKAVSVPVLPTDPLNNGLYHYTFCSDGNSWEINTGLESSQYQPKMGQDGGNDNISYEVGSNLMLIGNNGKCKY